MDDLDASLRRLLAEPAGNPGALLGRFFEAVGVRLEVPDPLPEPLERGARGLVGARPPGDAELPLGALAEAPFPMLVVSGGHMAGFETLCDEIAAETGADRDVIRGAAHLVPDAGAPFNERLESFMAASG